ncbi:MAG: toll/interleukin-1 receptor domain-containing protein [Fimbriimonas sp.]|nr:toll/interleukin-1 receptor domain-containing protein [Fimbriimonas sp.]
MQVAAVRQELFVSYAHQDAAIQSDLLRRLRPLFAASAGSQIVTWTDGQLLAGTRWRDEIFGKIDACAAALPLLSPAFLGSAFVKSEELPRLAAHPKPLVPVLLKPIHFVRHDLCGLDPLQIFGLRDRQHRLIAYGECTTSMQKDRFALDLFAQIEVRLGVAHP